MPGAAPTRANGRRPGKLARLRGRAWPSPAVGGRDGFDEAAGAPLRGGGSQLEGVVQAGAAMVTMVTTNKNVDKGVKENGKVVWDGEKLVSDVHPGLKSGTDGPEGYVTFEASNGVYVFESELSINNSVAHVSVR